MSNRQIRMLRLPQVINATGLSKTKICSLQKRGDFPMRVKLTARVIAWVEEEVQAWVARRIENTRLESVPKSSVIPGQSPFRANRKRAR
jgi:prophage regulatory protein